MTTRSDFEGFRNVMQACWQTAEDKGWHDETEYQNALNKAAVAVDTLSLNGSVPKELTDPIYNALHVSMNRVALANGVNIPEKLMLICCEAAEAMEDYRNPHLDPQKVYTVDKTSTNGYRAEGEEYYDETAKPMGVGSELADVVIRVMDLAQAAGIDLVYEMERKMEYNKSRPHRHGGKRA